jgi:hypothetical protein
MGSGLFWSNLLHRNLLLAAQKRRVTCSV